MKHNELRAIAHNAADSVASGISFLTGVYDHLNVFKDAGRSPSKIIVIDFLAGKIVDGRPSRALQLVASRLPSALETLCAREGSSIRAFRHLSVSYWSDLIGRPHFSVTLEDQRGRRTITDYGGIPGKRIKIRDTLGRLRPKPVVVKRVAS